MGVKMEVEALPLLRVQPALHLGVLVSRVVVHDPVYMLISRETLLQMVQEADKLTAAMPLRLQTSA